MKKTIFAFLLFAFPAIAEEPDWFKSGDILEIRQGEPWIEIYYSNSERSNSKLVEGEVFELNGVKVRVWINLGAKEDGSEQIIVDPIDDQVIALPAEAFVKDGEDVVVTIITPMF